MAETSIYDQSFYLHMDGETEYAARAILELVKPGLPGFGSVVDVGCGVGTWLRVCLDLGVQDILGLEGGWVTDDLLQVPADSVMRVDLSKPPELNGRFDLAVSCEVAEHLPPQSAGSFVGLLCGLSDFVLFSAAIPGQGGTNHVNEQWPAYWIDLFEKEQFVALDLLRKRIWSDRRIPSYYRQNILLFARTNRLGDLQFEFDLTDAIPAERYLLAYDRLTRPGLRHSLLALRSAGVRYLRGKLGIK